MSEMINGAALINGNDTGKAGRTKRVVCRELIEIGRKERRYLRYQLI